MPPTFISDKLWSAVDLPAAERLEAFVVHQENPARRLPFGIAELGHVDPTGTAMHRVGAGISGLFRDLSGFNDLNDLRIARIGPGVEDVDTRGSDPRHDQVAALDMRMRRVRAQAGRARVPAEMMELVADIRH